MIRRALSLLLIALCPLSSLLFADDKSPTEIKHPVDSAKFELTLTGSDGIPVVGATVKLYAVRCEEDRGSHYGWPTGNIGPAPSVTTDEKGIATFAYPVKFGAPSDWMTTSEVSMMIQHAEYVGDEFHVDPRNGKGEKQLKVGCELTISAQDASGKLLDNFGIVMAGPGATAKWLTNEGVKRSRAIPDGNWQTMLVYPKEDGEHLFSGVLPVRLANQQGVSIRKANLRPGLRLTGTLDEAVPRPVKNGLVAVWCLPKPAGRVHVDKDPSVSWMDYAEVNEDGSFEFKSLPRTGMMQFIALCDDWVIADGGGHSINGTKVDVEGLEDGKDQAKQITLQMQKTGSIEVTVVGPDDKPVQGIEVSTWPNQSWELSGSQVLGTAYRSADFVIREHFKPEPAQTAEESYFGRHRAMEYSQTTNQDGVAIIKNIPINHGQSLYVANDEFVLPKNNENDVRRMLNYVCESTEAKKITAKLVKREE